MICSFARVQEDKLQEIRSLEAEIGKTLLAYSCQDVTAAPLSDGDLVKIRDLENKIDLVLLAV